MARAAYRCIPEQLHITRGQLFLKASGATFPRALLKETLISRICRLSELHTRGFWDL